MWHSLTKAELGVFVRNTKLNRPQVAKPAYCYTTFIFSENIAMIKKV